MNLKLAFPILMPAAERWGSRTNNCSTLLIGRIFNRPGPCTINTIRRVVYKQVVVYSSELARYDLDLWVMKGTDLCSITC